MVNPQPPRTISGQILTSDNRPFNPPGYILRLFDVLSRTEIVPLSNPIPLPTNGTYRIPYTWQSTQGRNGPTLLVRVFDSQGNIVGQAGKQFAEQQETLNVTVTVANVPINYQVQGTVRQSNGTPLPGAIVHIVDWNRAGEDPLVVTRTNANGYYEGRFTSEQFQSSANEVGGPDLIVRVYNDQGQLLATSPRRNNAQIAETIDLTVTVLEPAPQEELFVVKGHLYQGNGLLLAGMTVRAFDRDLRAEQLLGQQTTDATGYYEIAYTRTQFRRAEKERADLVLRLFTPEGQAISAVDLTTEAGTPLETISYAGSDGNPIRISIWFNAPPVAEINGTVTDTQYQGLSEYERYLDELTPLLDGVAVIALTEGDISFLAAETQIDAQRISYLHLAAQRQAQTQIVAPVFYGLWRQNLPTDLALLLVREPDEWYAALKQAIATNLIPRSLETQLDEIVRQLQGLLPSYLAGNLPDSEPLPLTNLIRTILPEASLREQFMAEYTTYDGQDEAVFWERLQNQPAFQNGIAENIRFTFQVSPLTFNHLPLVQALQQERQQGRLQTTQDLVRLDESAWRNLLATSINNQPVGVPEGIPGTTAEERQQNYAIALTQLSEATFPTAAIAARLERDDDLPQRQDLLTFLNNNPDFDFETTPFRSYVLERGNGVLNGVQNQEAIAAAQRIFKVAPRYTLMKPLLADGLTSALAINQLGETQFVANYATPIGGTTQAKLIYRQAQSQSALAVAVLSRHHTAFDLIRPWVIPAQSPMASETTAIPDLQALFGSLTSCQCEHCQSIYSPAAYLVDCLNFLKQNRLLDDFRRRRPDIGSILLTCENTHTPLPYIDLSNEVLEAALSGTLDDTSYQTTRSAEELLAGPEHITEAVYNEDGSLKQAVYPQQFPFDLWLETARIYFKHLGTSRQEVIQLFHPGAEEATTAQLWEALEISAIEGEIITTVQTEIAMIQRFYNSSEVEISLDQLNNVPELLYRANLNYTELLEILDSGFVNPEREVLLVEEREDGSPGDEDENVASCDLSRYRLIRTSPQFFDRLHRFLRLYRTVNWSIPELDLAIQALGELASEGDSSQNLLNQSLLQNLAHVQYLIDELRLSVEEILSFWAPINTQGENSLYLLARSLRLRIPELLNLLQLTDLAPFSSPEQTKAFVSLVERVKQSGFKLTELAYLYLHEPNAVAVLEPDENQIAALWRTLQTGSQNLLNSPNDSLSSEDQLRSALTAELSLEASQLRVPNLTPSQINAALTLLREDWSQKSVDEQTRAGIQFTAFFGSFLTMSEALPILLGNSSTSEKAIYVLEPLRIRHLRRSLGNELIEFLPSAGIETALDFLASPLENNDANKMRLVELFGQFLDINEAEDIILDETSPVSRKLDYILQSIQRYRQRRDLVVQTLADVFKLDSTTIRLFLERSLNALSNPAKKAIADFLSLTPDNFASKQAAVQFIKPLFVRLHKVSFLITHFKLSVEETEYFAVTTSSIALNQIPIATPPEGTVHRLFQQWLTLSTYQELRDRLPSRKVRLIDVLRLESATPEALVDKLVEATGWSEQDLNDLGAEDLRNPQALTRRYHQIMLGQRIGITLSQLEAWATEPPSPEQAQQIRQTVKTKYDDKQWLAIVRPLENVLREKRRYALVSYLIHRPELWLPSTPDGKQPDANQLYEHFLIDVEMSACQLTSRIRQAIAAVQLFIQRCLMGLEGELELSNNLARQWETWRKTYRYWEANRKVFVYPENWIEPELRDDKTPFFKDLENTLLQNDVTQQVVEDGFLRYLGQLNDVAKLDIVGMYVQKEPGVDILHVFGRTPGIPHRYYYRRRIDSRYWTAWEKVELDIEGDHLIPVVWNRRLYLFWPIFTEKVVQQESISRSDEGTPPEKYWEIQLAYSEYRQAHWSAKIVSESRLDGQLFDSLDHNFREIRAYAFKALIEEESGNLLIYCFVPLTSRSANPLIPVGHFLFEGCNRFSQVTYGISAGSVRENIAEFFELAYLSPLGSESQYMRFSEQTDRRGDDRDALYLPTDSRASSSLKTLKRTPGTFNLLPPHQFRQFLSHQKPFFFQDQNRVFFVNKEVPPKEEERRLPIQPGLMRLRDELTQRQSPTDLSSLTIPNNVANRFREHVLEWQKQYIFRSFYHPYVCFFIKQLNRYGIAGLLDPDPSPGAEARELRRQLKEETFFARDYAPNRDVVAPEHLDPKDDIDFDFAGAYSQYNWELFFHAPLLVADRLMQNQQFAEAQKWFHYIFDPTVGQDSTATLPDPARFWKVKPFYEAANTQPTIEQLMRRLNAGDEKLKEQVAQWQSDPFNPHLIARLRITAYMKTVVMKYLDNLIAWGDHLFQQDTLETLGEATQVYVLAANILGQRPSIIPPRGTAAARTFNELEPSLDDFGNALVRLEEQLPAFGPLPTAPSSAIPSLLYFCIPANDKLLNYWDIVGDRLFKLRNCMNIEGIVRQLPLFEPPINPALLVRARAMGVDLRDVLSGSVSLSPYRFNVMLQKANELCAEVKSLGAALLSAYEKRDAEELARLRSEHEIRMLDAMKAVREKQLEEAITNKDALEETKRLASIRYEFYVNREFMNTWETSSLALTGISEGLRLVANILALTSGTAAAFPDFTAGTAGWAGTPVVLSHYGGSNVSGATGAVSRAFEMLATTVSTAASMMGVVGSYERRSEEWDLQARLAEKELAQIDKQIAAADIRLQIAQKELENYELQRRNAQEVDDYIRQKFTNQELYNWMVSEISAIYFQSYQLAYETARRTEQAYRFERGLTDSDFIRFGQWDSLRRGLMSGERLQLDLRRLEMAYLNENRREYELTKHISLTTLNPLALILLKETGQCEIELPETLFDLDYPGHYMRRIKSVSVTIPCVTGNYTNVNCTLTLLNNKTRIDNNTDPSYPENLDTDGGDPRFYNNFTSLQSVATSNGQNDSGLFELNFRDERYLPFEGSGVISRWRIEISGKWGNVEFPQFDFNTITDVILHLRYTARNGGEILKKPAIENLQTGLNQLISAADEQGLFRLFSLRHEFPTEWHRFLQSGDATFTVILKQQHFPFMFQGSGITPNTADLYLAGQRNPVERDLTPTPTPDDPWRFDLPGGVIRNALAQSGQGNIDAFLVCRYTTVSLAPWIEF